MARCDILAIGASAAHKLREAEDGAKILRDPMRRAAEIASRYSEKTTAETVSAGEHTQAG